MRKVSISAMLTLAILSLGALAAWSATAQFTPPPQQGDIFAVINFARADGANQNTSVSVSWGPFSRRDVVGRPYGNCATATPAGFVLMIRHLKPDSNPFVLTTSGTIVRMPYQGEAPPEISHACYKFLKFRARY
jgi:predicted ribosomally synthesized peptide with SipW-like signal peptide